MTTPPSAVLAGARLQSVQSHTPRPRPSSPRPRPVEGAAPPCCGPAAQPARNPKPRSSPRSGAARRRHRPRPAGPPRATRAGRAQRCQASSRRRGAGHGICDGDARSAVGLGTAGRVGVRSLLTPTRPAVPDPTADLASPSQMPCPATPRSLLAGRRCAGAGAGGLVGACGLRPMPGRRAAPLRGGGSGV